MKPVFDLIGTYKKADKGILRAIKRVLESGVYILGPEVKAFEEEFAKATKNKYCVGVASGTDAITVSNIGLGISQGSEIITSNFTAYPTVVGIVRSGMVPVVIDVGRNGLINEELIEDAITEKTKAIVPVHLFNRYCNMKEINRIAKRHNLKVIEDCAQRTFTKVSGDAAAYSFYPTKTLGAFGDAGAVCTNDKDTYLRLKCLRDYGQTTKNEFTYQGLNSRLDEIQAAILRVKLRKKAFLKTPTYRTSNTRGRLIDEMKKKGIETLIHYPYAVSEQEAFEGIRGSSLDKSIMLSRTILTLPHDTV